MQIHLVSGKGGVGKSVFALSLAHRLAQTGQKVLLVELGEESFFSYFLNLPTPLTYQGQNYSPGGFDLARWDGTSALSEYVKHLLKIESLHRLFFENQVTKSLVDAAPGLKELAILGKITSGPPRWVGPKLNYDHLVVDAFASGHFLALLKAPKGMADTFRFGPMAEQSRGILKTISSSQWTHLHLVTLAEELPVQETLDMVKDLKEAVPLRPQIWLNKWIHYPHLKPSDSLLAKEWSLLFSEQQRFSEKLSSLGPIHLLPFCYQLEPAAIYQTLSQEIKI